VIQPLGNNPLVLTATGSVRIAGQIQIGGQNGNGDYAYDSAVTSVPGGAAVAGGGRGGEGHPILFYPPDQVSYSNLVSPPYGGQGFGIDPVDGVMKRIGGGGGQCGMIDNPNSNGKYSTDHELDCNEFRSSNPGVRSRAAAAARCTCRPSAGKRRQRLLRQPPERARQRPAGRTGSHYTIRDIDDKVLACGQIGSWPSTTTARDRTTSSGRGQLKRLIGGQGGGSGASSVEGYYCGIWCDHDQDKSNDGVCNGEDFGPSGKYGDSVGDARGGGGGGGGGAVLIQALGTVVLNSTGRIDAHGGAGLGGEAIACSNFGGGGAGGAGGMVIIQSATDIRLDAGTIINVQEGGGDSASSGDVYTSCDTRQRRATADPAARDSSSCRSPRDRRRSSSTRRPPSRAAARSTTRCPGSTSRTR
jgi:hypothetical protein